MHNPAVSDPSTWVLEGEQRSGGFLSYNFHPIERDPFLLPPDMSQWLPKGHLAYFVIEVVETLDLSAFLAKFRKDGAGATAYHPKILLGVLLYAYCQGLRSSRQIERHCQEDVAYRVIAANQQPDHSTLSRFVAQNTQALSDLFVQALKLCAEAGLVKLGTLALDGTKLKASAALDSNRTHAKLKEEIEKILAEARAEDQREDGLYGSNRGDELPPDLRDPNGRGERLKACLEIVRQKEEQPRIQQAEKLKAWDERSGYKGARPKAIQDLDIKEARANVTDPESRMMQTRGGYLQGYNAQVVSTAGQIILAADVTQQETDHHQLKPMLEQAHTNAVAVLGPAVLLGTTLTDAGYWGVDSAKWAEREQIDWLGATRKSWKLRKAMEARKNEAASDLPECLTFKDRMERRLLTQEGYGLYKQRSEIVEPVIGQLKEVNNARRCSRRGVRAVKSEWRFTCAAHNLLKLFRSRK